MHKKYASPCEGEVDFVGGLAASSALRADGAAGAPLACLPFFRSERRDLRLVRSCETQQGSAVRCRAD